MIFSTAEREAALGVMNILINVEMQKLSADYCYSRTVSTTQVSQLLREALDVAKDKLTKDTLTAAQYK